MSIGAAEKGPHKAGVGTIVVNGLMKAPEAAELLAVSRSELYEMMDNAEVPVLRSALQDQNYRWSTYSYRFSIFFYCFSFSLV
jgi:hypothetical protein